MGAEISNLGRQLNNFSKTLSDDETAKSGLRSFILEAKVPGEFGKLSPVADSLKQVQTTDQAAFKSAFSTAGELGDNGFRVTPFLETVGKLEDKTIRQDFIKEVNGLLNASGTTGAKREALQNTISAISEIMRESDGEKEMSSLKNLLQGLSTKSTPEGKVTFLKDFEVKGSKITT